MTRGFVDVEGKTVWVAFLLFTAIVIVVGASKFGHPLASGLALWPLRAAVDRIIDAARTLPRRRPDSDDFGQER
jgi:hypothetical protein